MPWCLGKRRLVAVRGNSASEAIVVGVTGQQSWKGPIVT